MNINNSNHSTKLIDQVKKRVNSTLNQYQLLETCVTCSIFTSTSDKWLFTGLSGCLCYIVDYKEKKWFQFFDEDICEEEIKKAAEHMKVFYMKKKCLNGSKNVFF